MTPALLTAPPTADAAEAAEILAGLAAAPKRLPTHLLYDAEGSALFEAITELPEYYPTRTERALLLRFAPDMAVRAMGGSPGPLVLAELGAGSAAKTRLLVSALLERQRDLEYHPIDVSATALEWAESRISALFPEVRVRPVVGRYGEGLAALRGVPGRKLVLFLGSSLGNFEPHEAVRLLSEAHAALRPGDALLVGQDLAKSPERLVPAYDDAQGVTARFNLNLLARLNRDYGASFDLDAFRHVALWNARASRMEMHLESLADQEIPIPGLGTDPDFVLRLAEGERIHTENSYKLPAPAAEALFRTAGFEVEARWLAPALSYGLYLLRA